MKLVLYSGGQNPQNRKLHQALSDLVGTKRTKSFTYIASYADQADIFYGRARRRYSRFGFSKFNLLKVDLALRPEDVKRALDSDVIYLAGGNTFYFLKHLRRSGMINRLKKYAKEGGILAGLSAGGLILTPNICLAGYPKENADENDVGLKDLEALGLVDFEFYPHFERTQKLKEQLRRYSKKSRYPVVACADGGGIVVNKDQLFLLGHSAIWSRGSLLNLTSR